MLVVHPSSQCDICTRQFSERLAPYAIPCGHIFCSPCFQDSPTKSCALCRRPYNAVKIKKLHVDYLFVTSPRSEDPEMILLRRLAEALVLGDGTYSSELSAVVEYMDRWLTVSGHPSPSDFKGLKNIRALMEEYNFVQGEYYRLVEELMTLRAQAKSGETAAPESHSPGKKPDFLELKGVRTEPSQPSDFQSLIDMLKNSAWDPDLIRDKTAQRSSSTSSVVSSRTTSEGQEPFYHTIEEHQEDLAPDADQAGTSQGSARVPAQYSSSWMDLRRRFVRQQAVGESSSHPHQVLSPAEDVTPRTVRFSQSTSSLSAVSDILEEDEEEGAEEDGWNDDYSHNPEDASSHRQLTLHILLHGNNSESPTEQPSAPRLPTISLSSSASIASIGASSRQSSLSGSRLSHAVSIVTIDSTHSDHSWGTQSSAFSHMPGLRNFAPEPQSHGSRASSSSESRSVLLVPQPMESSLRRRPAKRTRLRREDEASSSGLQGIGAGRQPRSLPFLPTEGTSPLDH